jgi:inhibitor of cysteine peptidase
MRPIKWLVSILMFFYMANIVFAAAKGEPGIYTEDKRNILVTKDQPQFVIYLKANPTTGYNWFLREYDSKLVTPLKHTYEAPNTKLIGAPGFDVWTFAIKPAGFTVPQITQIRFTYARPWETAGQENQIVFRVSMQ